MFAIFILPWRTWKMWSNVQTKSGSLFLSIKVAHLVTLHCYYTAYLSLTINRKTTTITTIYFCCPGDKDRQALVKHLKRMITFATWIFQVGQKWRNNHNLESVGTSWVYITTNVAACSPDQGRNGQQHQPP